MNAPLIISELVSLDADLGSTKAEVITSVAGIIARAGRADADGLTRDALDRESKSPTGMPGGFAIPHCRSAAVSQPSLGFARLSPAVDFNGPDGPADLVFMIAASENGGADHMKLLTKLARALVKPEFVEQLRQAPDAQTVVDLIGGVVGPEEGAPVPAPATAAATDETAPEQTPTTHVVAITACPTGIAHTYMAADYLTAAGKKMGVDVKVEPQGSTATEPLDASEIEAADAVIFATDVGVKGRERFAGKPVIESGVKRAINEPEKMVAEAVAAAKDPHAHRVPAGHGEHQEPEQAGSRIGWGKRIQQALMTGVSYMIPFVAAGGLLIALGFLFGGYEIAKDGMDIALHSTFSNLPAPTAHALGGSATMTYIGAVFFAVGQAAFGFLLPALAGYIGFGLADRPGIAPGFVAGAVAGVTGAGFIGAIVGGLLGGLVRLWVHSPQPAPLAAWSHAGRHHPARRVPHSRRPHVRGARPSACRSHQRPQQLAGWYERSIGCHPWNHPGPHDVLRPGRPHQQSGVPLRDDEPRRHQRRIPQGDGRRHGSRDGPTPGDGPVDDSASEPLPTGRARERHRYLVAGSLVHLRRCHPLRSC